MIWRVFFDERLPEAETVVLASVPEVPAVVGSVTVNYVGFARLLIAVGVYCRILGEVNVG